MLLAHLNSDPLLVDSAGLDWHLQSGSPAIGTGIDMGITEDYDGSPYNSPPSLGAYEYQ